MSRRAATDLVRKFVFLLVVKRKLVVQDVVEIFLHEDHCIGEPVFLVVPAVVHVGVIAEEDKHQTNNEHI